MDKEELHKKIDSLSKGQMIVLGIGAIMLVVILADNIVRWFGGV